MGSYTSPDSLYKPAVGEEGWGLAVDENFDTIQTRLTDLGSQTETLEALPANLAQAETLYHQFLPSITGVYRYNSGTPAVATDFNVSDVFFTDLSAGTIRDPGGWTRNVPFTDPTGYWDITFPASTYFVLPPGRYIWQANWRATGNLVSTETYGFSMDTCTQDVNDTINKYDDVTNYILLNSALGDRRYMLGTGIVEVNLGGDPADLYTGEDVVPFFLSVFVTSGGVSATTLAFSELTLARMW